MVITPTVRLDRLQAVAVEVLPAVVNPELGGVASAEFGGSFNHAYTYH